MHEIVRAEEMRLRREQIARRYLELLADVEEIDLPPNPLNRIHSWQLFPIRLRLQKLGIDRSEFFIQALRRLGVGACIPWRPLHLHPYYRQTFGWRAQECAVAASQWERVVNLPIYSAMDESDVEHVAAAVRTLCYGRNRTAPAPGSGGTDAASQV
jgi:dTDP-4-amino-4,6-dideoxygalactose transaminase